MRTDADDGQQHTSTDHSNRLVDLNSTFEFQQPRSLKTPEQDQVTFGQVPITVNFAATGHSEQIELFHARKIGH